MSVESTYDYVWDSLYLYMLLFLALVPSSFSWILISVIKFSDLKYCLSLLVHLLVQISLEFRRGWQIPGAPVTCGCQLFYVGIATTLWALRRAENTCNCSTFFPVPFVVVSFP